MKKQNNNRRDFLKILTVLPVGFFIGCSPGQQESETKSNLLSSEESLKKLIVLIGPWTISEKEEAEGFALRFIKASNNTSPYLPESSGLIQSILSKVNFESGEFKEINLRKFSDEERELLLQLVQQLHSYLELRNYISKEPKFGECQTDNLFYTKAPV